MISDRIRKGGKEVEAQCIAGVQRRIGVQKQVAIDIVKSYCQGHARARATNFSILGSLCGLVVRYHGYRYRSPGFDSRGYHIL
jgi:hypothetical protein